MAEVRFSGSRTQMIVAGLMALAFVLSLVAMFMPWWTLRTNTPSVEVDGDVRPFDKDSRLNDEGDDLSTGVLIVGILWILVVLGAVVTTGLALFRLSGATRLDRIRTLATFGTALIALAAILLAVFLWPNALNNDDGGTDFGWWDSQEFGSVTLSTFANVGWYIAILGGLILPIVAGVMDARQALFYVPPMTSRTSTPMPMTPYVPPPAVTYNRKPAVPEPTPMLDAMDKRRSTGRRLSTPKTSSRKSTGTATTRKKK